MTRCQICFYFILDNDTRPLAEIEVRQQVLLLLKPPRRTSESLTIINESAFAEWLKDFLSLVELFILNHILKDVLGFFLEDAHIIVSEFSLFSWYRATRKFFML